MSAVISSDEQLERVRPGDLITATWMNEVVDTLNDLLLRVANLEVVQPDGHVVITDLIFTAPLRLGDPIEIRGQNFGFSRGAQQVTFDGIPITEFGDGSSNTRLLVRVPVFATFPETGRDVTLVVSNGVSSATRNLINVLPIDRPVSGNFVDVLWETVTPNPVLVGSTVRLGYRLRSRVATRTFTIEPVVSRPELNTGIEVRDESNALLPSRQIQLSSLQEKLFFVILPNVPSTLTTGMSFTVTVSAISGGVTGSDSRPFTIGTAITPSDPTITLSVSGTGFNAVDDGGDPVPGDGSYDTATKTIRLRAGAFGRMELEVTFEQVGTYTVTLIPSGLVNGWTRNLETGGSIVIEEDDLATGPSAHPIRFNLRAIATATPSPVEVRVQRVGATTDERADFQLALLS